LLEENLPKKHRLPINGGNALADIESRVTAGLVQGQLWRRKCRFLPFRTANPSLQRVIESPGRLIIAPRE